MYRNYNALSKGKNAMLRNEIPIGITLPKVKNNSSLFFSLFIMCCMFLTTYTSKAQTNGIYESYAILSLNGGANAFYDMNAVTANPDMQGSVLGSFNASNSLVVKGGQNRTFKCDGGDITNGHLYWRVWLTSAGASGSFNSILMSFVSNDPGGCGGNQTWEGTSGATNIISGLTVPGNYTLEVYSDADGIPGTTFSSNGGNNYKSTFTFCGPTSGALPVGNYSIPGCFPSVAAAATYINTNGVTGSGTVQFDIAAGGSETSPAGGIVIRNDGVNLGTGTATTAIKFVKAAGSAYTITAPTQTAGSINDAIIKIIGSDYITIDGLTLLENAANSTTTAASNNMTEFGIALFYASTTNGAQNNTFQNNTITLKRIYQNSFGIYSNNRHSPTAMTTAADATSAAGSNSFNKVYANTISNVNYGSVFIGSGALTASGAMDNGTDIGGTSLATGNTYTNWGGGATTAPSGYIGLTGNNYCIFINNTYNDNISYNTITSGAAVTALTIGGLLKNYSGGATAQPTGTITTNINNNTVTVTNAPTTPAGSVIGLNNQGLSPLATATVNMNNNVVQNCTVGGTAATTAGLTSITNLSAPGVLNMNGNSVINNSIASTAATTGTIVGISNSGAAGTVSMNNNVVRDMSSTSLTTGQMQGIANSGLVTTSININNNQLGNASGGFFSSSVASGGALFGIVNAGSAATCALSIQNNDIRGITYSVPATSLQLYINLQGTAPLSHNVSNNTFTNLAANTSGSVSFISNSISIPTGGSQTISDNSIVTGFSKTVAGGVVSGISTTGSSSGVTSTWNNNNFSNITVTGFTAVNGISNADGGTVNHNITNNRVTNVTGSTGTVTGIISSNGGGDGGNGNVISGNIIANLSGDSVVNGINYTAGTNSNIFKNKIYGLTGNGASGSVNGVLVNGGSSNTIYNNLIGDLQTPAANGINPLNGINILGSVAANLYFNTISLSSSNSSGLFGSSAVNADTTVNLTMKNNILKNTSVVNGGGVSVAYRRNSTTLTSYQTASNSNLLYSTNAIYYDGTNTDLTINDYKTRVASRDSNSFSENAVFVSTVGSNANFLHIDPATPTQIESAGVSVAGITDDYDGNTRDVATPDIGADEFTGVGIDLSGPSISFNPATSNPCNLTSIIITVAISDASSVSTGATAPRIYFRKNAGAYSSVAGTLSAGTIDSGTWTFSITYATVGGVVASDVIDYFVVAQDLLGNVGGNPSGGLVLTNVNTVTTPPTTPLSYTVASFLSGTYTVGVAGTYPTLTAAITAYNNNCLGGAVVFELLDATYTEAAGMTISKHLDASAVNTLTIRPAAGVTAAVSAAAASGALIKILGNYVTIDGSNNASTSRNLTLSNTSTTAPNVVVIGSTGASPINNVTVKNSIAINGVNSSSAIVTSDGASIGAVGYFNAISILNNDIRRAFVGVFNIAGPGNGSGLTVSNNTLNTSGTSAIRRIGVYVQGVDGVTVSGNTIGNFEAASGENDTAIWLAADTRNATVSNNAISGLGMTLTTGFAPTGILITSGTAGANNMSVTGNTISGMSSSGGAAATSANGISVTSTTGDVTISKNTVNNIRNNSTAGWGANGILLSSTLATANVVVSNNFVYDVSAVGFAGSASDDNGYGITVNSGAGYGIYYNTVNMNTNQTTAGGLPSAFLVGVGVTTPGAINLRNNIFVNSQTAGSTQRYSIFSAAPNTVFAAIDYNDYFSSGANLGFIGSNRADLTAIQAGFGGNANSKNVSPVFVNPASNLHLIPASNIALDNFGTPIAGITTDFDNDTRSATAPDMGADEFSNSSIVNLKLFIEGYYIGGSTMASVKNNQDGVSPVTDVENITVELHNTSAPYGVAHTTTAVLKTNGNAVATFTSAPSGSFYISVSNSNAIKTWSKLPQTVGGTTSYDFSTALTQSYGDSMKNFGGVYAFYSGDLNQDGSIDGSDAPDLFNAVDNSLFGVQITDLNGDGSVDNSDVPLYLDNSDLSIYSHDPNNP